MGSEGKSWRDPTADAFSSVDTLPLYVLDGEPAPTATERTTTTTVLTSPVWVRASLRHGRALRSLPCKPSPACSAAGFLRLLAVPRALLPVVLAEWWTSAARDGAVELGPLTVEEPPLQVGSGTWAIVGSMHWTTCRRSVPVEVLLWPHLGDLWTMVVLEPDRPVTRDERGTAAATPPSTARSRCSNR